MQKAPQQLQAPGQKSIGGSNADFYGSVGEEIQSSIRKTARWFETSEDTDPAVIVAFCCEDFQPRKLKAPLVLCWLALQALGLLFQFALFCETSRHLAAFEETLATNCSPEHQQNDVCLGPAWNLSFSGTVTFPPMEGEDSRQDFDFIIPADRSFKFQTKSRPPTFLLGVEPQEPHVKAHWKVAVAAQDAHANSNPSAAYDERNREADGVLPPLYGTGNRYKVFSSTSYKGSGEWTASLDLKSRYSENAVVRVYVVDSRIEHLDDIHNQTQCSFEGSWQNFNERHNGEHHRVLTYARRATGLFLMVSIATFAVMLHRFYFYIEGGKLLARVIAVKFLVQDFPQQFCIAAYLYGWYANNGLRCQMCLFHPSHCDDEHPLHTFNALVCIFTLLSATSNQLLLQAKAKKYDDEEECFLWFARGAIFSVSVLPFATAMCLLSSSLLHFRSVIFTVLAGVTTLVGWGTLMCVPMFALCEEELLL